MTPEQIERMRTALKHSKEKLELYRAAHGGEYVGGMEYTRLIAEIDKLLSDSEPEPIASWSVTLDDKGHIDGLKLHPDVPRYQQVDPSRYLPTTITVDGVEMTPDEYSEKFPNGH